LVFLADKLAKGDRPVTIDERFGAFLAYGGSQSDLEFVRRRLMLAKFLEAHYGQRLGKSVGEVALTPINHSLEHLAYVLLGRQVG
jgi:hypothetical protein